MNAGLKQFFRALIIWLDRISSPRWAKRRAILSAPFPESWKQVLAARSVHYRRLPVARRREFHRQLQVFLAERRITGVEMDVSDEMRVLVAASAVSLSVGWPAYAWDQLSEVLLYPDYFDRDYRFGKNILAGQAHPWGIVILSEPALRRSFDTIEDGYHVGFHEFAHLLDLTHSRFDGIPPYLPDDGIRRWLKIMQTEEERLRGGDSVLSPYGLTGPEELFAVTVEAFLQTPVVLAHRHRELYTFLASYFCQDPAGWSSRLNSTGHDRDGK